MFIGDRPYKCDTCQKEFNYLTTYKRHLNIHKGEKPFACEHCDKKFTRLNYLKNHLNTHAKHSSQESQTDFKYEDSSSRQTVDVDSQEDLGAMEAESAAQSIQNEGKSMVDDEARTAESEGELRREAIKVEEVFGRTLIQICPGLSTNEVQFFMISITKCPHWQKKHQKPHNSLK